MRRLARWLLIPLALVGWAFLGGIWQDSHAPPANVQSFETFLEHFGPPDFLGLADQDHLVARPPVSRWYLLVALPSDRPAHVFDRSGRLVDFSTDPGDDPRFQDRWLVASPRALSLDQARRWIRER